MATSRMTIEEHQRDSKKKLKAEEKREATRLKTAGKASSSIAVADQHATAATHDGHFGPLPKAEVKET